MSCDGVALLLRTGPYEANSGTSASCVAYADCFSAADGARGASAAFFDKGAPIVSKVLGPGDEYGEFQNQTKSSQNLLAASWAAWARLIFGTEVTSKRCSAADGSLTYATSFASSAASEKTDSGCRCQKLIITSRAYDSLPSLT